MALHSRLIGVAVENHVALSVHQRDPEAPLLHLIGADIQILRIRKYVHTAESNGVLPKIADDLLLKQTIKNKQRKQQRQHNGQRRDDQKLHVDFSFHGAAPLLYHVSNIADGPDHAPRVPQLLPQRPDMHIQRPGFSLKIDPPDPFQNNFPRHHDPRVMKQQL